MNIEGVATKGIANHIIFTLFRIVNPRSKATNPLIFSNSIVQFEPDLGACISKEVFYFYFYFFLGRPFGVTAGNYFLFVNV
jgi:hypothetical protein